jgi:REP element-mobilizing transposase RayT
MPNYRRAFVPGGCWFFTVNLLDRRRRLLTDHIDALREATRLTQTRQPFFINAMVVLPDHIHAVWTLPPGDADFSLRWRLIKIGFAKAVSQDRAAQRGPHRARRTRHGQARPGRPHPRLAQQRAASASVFRWSGAMRFRLLRPTGLGLKQTSSGRQAI